MPIESINNNIVSAVLQSKFAKKDPVDNKGSAASTSSSATDDTVSITATTHGIKQTAEVDSPEQAVNEVRVAKIKTALQDGNYVIDHDRLAKKMLQFELNIPDTT